jgi:hypothetical protein
MNWCGSKKLKNVSESVILAYLVFQMDNLPPKLQVEFRKLAVFIYLPLFENDLSCY